MKKTIILIYVIFCVNSIYAQTWQELNQKIDEAYKIGDYQTAIKFAEQAKEQAKKEFGPENLNYTTTLNNLAILYYNIGNYSKAEPLYTEALNIIKKMLGTENPNYASSLYNLAKLYEKIGNYQKAEPLYIETINIRKKVLGQENPEYATSINDLAALYHKLGNYSKAEPLYIEALNIRKKVLGQEHSDYASSLNNLAELYRSLGNFPKAESLYLEALNIKKKKPGTDHPEYAILLNNLALFYQDMGNYPKAESLYIEAVLVIKKVLGEKHPIYASVLINLAALYRDMGNYSKAEPLYLEVLNIRKTILGPEHLDYAATLNSLAGLYNDIGNYSKAELLYIEALNIKKKVLGTEHQGYATSLNNLAELYRNLGEYSKAEPLYIESLNIIKKELGQGHPEYAGALNNLALLYHIMGNYSKAEPLYLEALNIRKKILGVGHPDYANSLNNLAALYYKMRNYPKAEPLYVEALDIRKKVLGPEHPEYAISLNNLAELYRSTGDYSKAEPLYIETLNIVKKVLGTENHDYIISLNNLALVYQKMGNYSKAESIYIQALNLTKKISRDHPDYTIPIGNLASLYVTMGKYSSAEPLYIQANENINKQIEKNFTFLSEQEKEQFLNNNIGLDFEEYNYFFLKRKEQNPSVAGYSFNNELAHKGMLLQNNLNLRQKIYNSGDNDLIKLYDKFIDTHKELTKIYTSTNSKNKLDSIEVLANLQEKELIKKGQNIPDFENLTRILKVTWKEVQQNLKPKEVAIEFINFHSKFGDSTFYCALILRKLDTNPQMIYLFEERQLQNILSNPQRLSNENYITKLYGCKLSIQSNQLSLYQLIWQPIDILLNGITTVYMAPCGLLHKVAFNAIPVTDSTYLSDKYNLNVLSSTRILTQNYKAKQPSTQDFDVVLYGGIRYDVDSIEMLTNSKQYQKQELSFYDKRGFNIPANIRGSVWKYLPNTLIEVDDIKKLLDSKQIHAKIFKEKQATEESFKHLADQGKSPDVIHIASHGFFFPEIKSKSEEIGKVIFRGSGNKGMPNEPVFTYSENPLLRSGILFAGANRVWNNKPSIENVEDGTLTAYEVSNMNLSNTELVVLSACETGLGDVKGSEGVFGLQRAFKMSGVKNIIMSLWEVPDTQTSELMKLFYKNWLAGMNMKKAFSGAQNAMRKRYSPFYWAAFILVE